MAVLFLPTCSIRSLEWKERFVKASEQRVAEGVLVPTKIILIREQGGKARWGFSRSQEDPGFWLDMRMLMFECRGPGPVLPHQEALSLGELREDAFKAAYSLDPGSWYVRAQCAMALKPVS